jgi:L-fuculose-phosphate aldolase
MNVVVRDKADYHEQTTQRMNKHLVVPEWSDRQKLALAASFHPPTSNAG